MKRGFTLIELMVTIGIIAVLMALLLTVIGRAKALAQKTACMSKQKQWALAFISYSEENKFIPREGYDRIGRVTLDNWSQIKGRPIDDTTTDSSDVWYNALPGGDRLPGVKPARDYSHPSKRVSFYDKQNFFHCPAAKFPEKAYRPNYGIALFSIAMNSQLIQFPKATTSWNSIESSKNASRTPLFLDGMLEGEKKIHPFQPSDFLGQPSIYANRFSGRHLGGGNIVFAGGDVQWFRGNEVVQTDESKPLTGGPILPPEDIVWGRGF